MSAAMADGSPGAHSPQATPPGLVRLAVTLGDPAGIGPEIVARVLAAPGAEADKARMVVVGRAAHLRQGARAANMSVHVEACREDEAVRAGAGLFDDPPREATCIVIEPCGAEVSDRAPVGRVDATCGAAAWSAVTTAVHLIDRGVVDAIVTGPLNKEALRLAGCPHPGHTELLAELAGAKSVGMLLVGGGLRVALVTIHEALIDVPKLVTEERILGLLRMMHGFIPWFLPAGGERDGQPVRLAVSALNPHAGEAGMFGREEGETIEPAIAKARAEGIDAVGPLAADTLFHRQRLGEFDAVLAMYHDQALIPVKTLDFERGVNVTMGLPFIRTSVDHGTAFELAGRGVADASSLRAAVETAVLLERNRRRSGPATDR